MRIVFMGAPEFAAPTLRAIVSGGLEVIAVYTRAPKPAGRRGLQLAKTAIHRLSDELAIPVLTPASLRGTAEQQAFLDHAADAAVVVAYGLILPPAILAAPRLGCFNLHASLLPRWRGAAPIQRAIMAGDSETGVCVMQMEAGLDVGPIAFEQRLTIEPTATAGEITEILAHKGAIAMTAALHMLEGGRIDFRPQRAEGATYARKIEKRETQIDWRQDADAVRSHIHGLSPTPGAWSEIDLGRGLERIKLLRVKNAAGSGPPGTVLDDALTVACGRGAIQIVEAQRSGKQAMPREEFQRGAQVPGGARFILIDGPQNAPQDRA
jgi:methionyl-tRNA formyltransferase